VAEFISLQDKKPVTRQSAVEKGETYVTAVTAELDPVCFTDFLGARSIPGNAYREDAMQNSNASVSVPHPAVQNKPLLTSFDSGQECSLEHWLEVTCLVEREELDLDLKLLLVDPELPESIVH
jgi:hypothetical protein